MYFPAMTSLKEELKQSKPFGSREQEAALNISRTAALIEHEGADMLKAFGITGTQFNVLRILRGAGQEGLCRYEISDRMVNQVPDVTRLLDRLEEAGFVTRERDTEDRRQVNTRITDAGLALLDQLEEPILELHRKQLGHLSEAQLAMLIELLSLARSR
jgi:DNA-binding MarR family transcriptional regulator